jgi:AraC family transcriptional regulator of adaptative response / DNA-3-methyladenine glycosylase II
MTQAQSTLRRHADPLDDPLDDPEFAERYRAMQSRDARFDGQFITGVHSTGIYCRPSCPAVAPKPSNVSFYLTAAAAHEAGLRACKRCLPDAVPGSPQWDLRDDLAARAMRLIADGVVEREGVPGLAARLGYTPRHLTRVLTSELGAGPLALSRAHRAQTARSLLTATALPVADVAFASGFGSIRQFNDTIREVYERSPLELRAAARLREHRPSGAPVSRDTPDAATAGMVRLRLPARAPFDAAGVFAWLAMRALPGLEVAGPADYRRTLRLPGGPALVHFAPSGDEAAPAIDVEARLSTLADLPPLVARVRRLFDLDADAVAIDAALAGDPALAASVAATPGMRVPRRPRTRVPRSHRAAGVGGVGAHRTPPARRSARRASADHHGRRARPALPRGGRHRRGRRGGAPRSTRSHPHDHRRRRAVVDRPARRRARARSR